MSLFRYPQRPPGIPRKVYFDYLPDFASALVLRGYEPVLLGSLSRDTEVQEREYLKCKLQAVEEGTVEVTEEQLVALKESIKLCFPKGVLTLDVSPSKGEGILEALGWGRSRFTLRGNTTLVPMLPESIGAQNPKGTTNDE